MADKVSAKELQNRLEAVGIPRLYSRWRHREFGEIVVVRAILLDEPTGDPAVHYEHVNETHPLPWVRVLYGDRGFLAKFTPEPEVPPVKSLWRHRRARFEVMVTGASPSLVTFGLVVDGHFLSHCDHTTALGDFLRGYEPRKSDPEPGSLWVSKTVSGPGSCYKLQVLRCEGDKVIFRMDDITAEYVRPLDDFRREYRPV